MVRQYQLAESPAQKRPVPELVHSRTGEASPASPTIRTGATHFVMDVKNASHAPFWSAAPGRRTPMTAIRKQSVIESVGHT